MSEDEDYLDEVVQEFDMSEGIIDALSDWLEVEEGMKVVGVAVSARLENPDESDNYYESFVLPQGLYAHSKLGLMSAGKEIATERLNGTIYKDVIDIRNEESKKDYTKHLMETLSADEEFEAIQNKLVEYFNFHKYTPQVVEEEDFNQGYFNEDDDDMDEDDGDEDTSEDSSSHKKITVAFKKAENRIISEGVMLIHLVELETNYSFYAYKQIPEASPVHSQKQLWEIGYQNVSDRIEEF